MMDKNFIGRQKEIQLLQDVMDSNKAEFVAVYGRRRVGKTYLIQQFFNNDFTFSVTGVIGGTKEEEMYAFMAALRKIGYEGLPPKTWMEALDVLATTIEEKKSKEKIVIYIDELPCFDTRKSGFTRALAYFWNSWAVLHNRLILIVCGSSTSWMMDNIINNHAGLHNRITHSIYLTQFTLYETEQFLFAAGIKWPRLVIVQAYMILGGIPFYLSLLSKKQSLPQNIDRIFFTKNAELSDEYRRLYSSIFISPEPYLKIIESLYKAKKGMTRKELLETLNIESSGTLTACLENLTSCDIIRRYCMKVNGKLKYNDSHYQLVDFFTLFYLNFSKKNATEDYWQQHINTPTINTWCGLAFEHVCMAHIRQIRHALGLDRIAVEYYAWRNKQNGHEQADMIIERADNLINFCEVKYSKGVFVIDKQEDLKMRNRMEAFTAQSKTRCGLLPTWVTTFGISPNQYAADVQYQVTIDDLFLP